MYTLTDMRMDILDVCDNMVLETALGLLWEITTYPILFIRDGWGFRPIEIGERVMQPVYVITHLVDPTFWDRPPRATSIDDYYTRLF